MTVCLYLPDGRVGFMYKRPTIADNDALDAGGLTWEIVTPFEELTVRYHGKVVVLDDPTEMADPKAAFTANPYDECEVDLTFTRAGPGDRCSAASPTAARGRGRGVRQGPLRAARRGPGSDPRRRRGVGGRRVRPPRPLLGPALLAGALVLPVADRQRRPGLRLHGQPGGQDATDRAPAAASCGRTASSTSATTSSCATESQATTPTTGPSRARCARRGRARSGRSPAR